MELKSNVRLSLAIAMVEASFFRIPKIPFDFFPSEKLRVTRNGEEEQILKSNVRLSLALANGSKPAFSEFR